jgi:4-hydroxy-4-methyl-2-oxoglutarate aldolase
MTLNKGYIARLRKLAVATLSDGCDQIAGRRGYMDFDVQGRINARKIVGTAATVLEGSTYDPHLPDLAFDAIDESPEGSVIVIGTGGEKNVAVWGELMNMGATVNGHEGVVVDGGARDVELIRRDTDFPVYARSIVPASSVGRLKTIARDIPVEVGGVLVSPGDYIVGDDDGIVSIPAEHVEAIINFAEEAEATEEEMVLYIKEVGSIRAATKKFGRA